MARRRSSARERELHFLRGAQLADRLAQERLDRRRRRRLPAHTISLIVRFVECVLGTRVPLEFPETSMRSQFEDFPTRSTRGGFPARARSSKLESLVHSVSTHSQNPNGTLDGRGTRQGCAASSHAREANAYRRPGVLNTFSIHIFDIYIFDLIKRTRRKGGQRQGRYLVVASGREPSSACPQLTVNRFVNRLGATRTVSKVSESIRVRSRVAP